MRPICASLLAAGLVTLLTEPVGMPFRINSADALFELTLSNLFTGLMVCMPFPTSPSRTTVPFISCLAAHEFFLLCELARDRDLCAGEGGFKVSPSKVVCLERGFRGVLEEAADGACSTREGWLDCGEVPAAVDPELLKIADEAEACELSDKAARSGSV